MAIEEPTLERAGSQSGGLRVSTVSHATPLLCPHYTKRAREAGPYAPPRIRQGEITAGRFISHRAL
jgi:hypothetical protein